MLTKFLGRRADLPLDRDSLGRYLPFLIAFMVYLAIMALMGLAVLNALTEKWDKGVAGTLSVQIAPTDTPSQDAVLLQAVLRAVRATDGVASAEPLSKGRIFALLEPWLGAVSGSEELPIPALIDVKLKPGVQIDVAALSKRVSAISPGISVDDHRVWLDQLVRLLRTIEGLAALVLALITVATVGTVVFTTRTSLAVHQGAIEVLHLIGAQDVYVAGQFAHRALVLGLKGGFLGLLLAAPTLWGIRALAEQMDSGLIPEFNMTMVHWSALVFLPIIVALIAMLTARVTVMRNLGRML
ncbi:MAG: cell division protein [Rhodospirillaceae bacterium]|jgi:cell division transport system permease protein|nr:cell division protein [Rhodospirillales bacterium]MBT3905575.1 cell division protein [Rhodospirillaceae bacterium]MBT4702673.1 cell division protein [Rhodospirillaceae bacterium]MBT5035987.1 cell division protein [Rhodospirillaceae bacterium]MBT6220771.1 cell division protein [Rhodospirillaceae bacterium]